MRVETNKKLARRNRQYAQYASLIGLGMLILGLFINFQLLSSEDVVLSTAVPFAILLVTIISTTVAVRLNNNWARLPRPENALRDGLKGMSNKAVLYNYHHNPVRHVLIAPQGVFAITTRFQDGNFEVNGDRWKTKRGVLGRLTSLLRFDGIGEPTLEAQAHAAKLAKKLEPIAPDVPVQPLIVFTSPRVNVVIEDPVVPVLHADPKVQPSLKNYMRDVLKDGGYPTLTQEQIDAFEEATLPNRA